MELIEVTTTDGSASFINPKMIVLIATHDGQLLVEMSSEQQLQVDYPTVPKFMEYLRTAKRLTL